MSKKENPFIGEAGQDGSVSSPNESARSTGEPFDGRIKNDKRWRQMGELVFHNDKT